MTSTLNRYIRISPGVRRDTVSGNFQATVVLNGKQRAKTFTSIREAKTWLKTAATEAAKSKSSTILLEDALNLYINHHVKTLSTNTQQTVLARFQHFLNKQIRSMPLNKITAGFLDTYLKTVQPSAHQKRCNYRNDLKTIKSFFNWYASNYDEGLINPIKPRHTALSRIKPTQPLRRKLTGDEIAKFLSCLDGVFLDMATIQFFTAARIAEIAGLHWESVNLEQRVLQIKHCLVWSYATKEVLEIKSMPKNGKPRNCTITDSMLVALNRREEKKNGTLVFHLNGTPIKYRMIQHHYGMALKKAGLSNVTSTHFLRHSAANIVRSSGSLDHAQSLTGHSSRAVVEKTYTEMPTGLQSQASNLLEQIMKSN